MANIFRLIDITGDPLYIKGFLEGKFKQRYEVVKSTILKSDLDDARIADIFSISIEYVAIVRKEVTTAKKSA